VSGTPDGVASRLPLSAGQPAVASQLLPPRQTVLPPLMALVATPSKVTAQAGFPHHSSPVKTYCRLAGTAPVDTEGRDFPCVSLATTPATKSWQRLSISGDGLQS
jgi:hypothetical protein